MDRFLSTQLLEAQHGVVTGAQLLGLGLGAS
jgi:hypothetical protein